MRNRIMAAGMAVTVAALAATAAPASAETVHIVTAADTPADARLAEARALREQAESLYSEPRQWRKAARLLERSAELRSETDAEAFTCLLAAGRIRAAIGDERGALQALSKAAAHAMARGAVLDAATAYIDAGYVAAKYGRPGDARGMFDRAGLLLESPLLSVAQRDALRQRLPA
jgi:tetratricopeptide (TPR) repeat protein